MNVPEYIAPASLEDALKVKREYGDRARTLAGGTDLILRMRDPAFAAGLLIDLRRVGLNTISRNASEMRLGSGVTQSQILADDEIAASFPALVEACRSFAGPPIRNRGTLGGNLVNASPAADLAPPLMAYDARVVLASSSGDRVLPIEAFFTGPGRTLIESDEILSEVRLPLTPPGTAATFTKLGQRCSMAISIVNSSTRLTLGATATVSDARIALGSVAPTPVRAVAAERMLIGQRLSTELVDQAAAQASAETAPITDLRASKDYRRRMARVLVHRGLLAAWKELARNAVNG